MTDLGTNPLILIGDASAAVCEGEFCDIPDHHEQAIVDASPDGDRI